MIDYNYNSLKKENPDLYESIDFNIAKILKKYNSNMYKLFVKYLASNKKNNYYGNKIFKYLYYLYLNSLTKDDLKDLKFINKNINKLKKGIEFEFLATLRETSIIDIPPLQKDNSVTKQANKIILRDNLGFYSNDKNIQDKIDNEYVLFETLNSYLINKEKVMDGKRKINSKVLTRKEILVIANFLGYGSIREEILNKQSRIKNKSLIKTKEL